MVNATLNQAVCQHPLPAEDEILVEEKNVGKFVTLNRPRVLNCLNVSMVQTLIALYEKWEEDENVHFILLKGAGRVFCAGGDLRMFYNLGKTNESWTEVVYSKYWLDYHVATYKKPLIAIWHGLVMGGGAGLTVPGMFAVATEKTVFSMPEAALGLHTDCGSSYWLSRLPGRLGEFLALTGQRLDGRDMLACGLATHFVPLKNLPELEERLSQLTSGEPAAIRAILDDLSTPVSPTESSILRRQATIDNIFSKNSVEEILAALDAQKNETGEEWIRDVIKTLRRSSPTGLGVTCKSIRLARKQTLAEGLQREYRLTINALRGTISEDLYEGIRAIVVEKDNSPMWKPATLQEVDPENLDLVFQPFEEKDELHLPVEEPRWRFKYQKA